MWGCKGGLGLSSDKLRIFWEFFLKGLRSRLGVWFCPFHVSPQKKTIKKMPVKNMTHVGLFICL